MRIFRGQNERLEEPRGMRQVPLGRAGVRHRLEHVVLGLQRGAECSPSCFGPPGNSSRAPRDRARDRRLPGPGSREWIGGETATEVERHGRAIPRADSREDDRVRLTDGVNMILCSLSDPGHPSGHPDRSLAQRLSTVSRLRFRGSGLGAGGGRRWVYCGGACSRGGSDGGVASWLTFGG